MKQTLEIATTIILAVGGTSTIIIGLANYLGKLWSNIALESEKSKYNKELEK